MQITTSDGIELTLTREELTVLRRNVALGYVKRRRRLSDGEIDIVSDRRPHWAGFQQRLITPGEESFIRLNPLDDGEIVQVTVRCVRNLKKSQESVDFEDLIAFTRKREYTRSDREEQLEICERIAYDVSQIIEVGKSSLIHAYCDLHVLTWEIGNQFIYDKFEERL